MQANRVYILDLDGTLMPSEAIDNRCYWLAVNEVFGTAGHEPTLEGFRHVTDIGILDQWCRETFDRQPLDREIRAVRDRFLDLTRNAARNEPGCFAPFPGLTDWLERRRSGEDYVAIATGGWGHTARFKLEVSGLASHQLPLACADDDISRTGIMRRALALSGGTGPVTFIGDGVWDLAAAAGLGWSFIGRANGPRADALRAAGARQVISDFAELE